MEIGKKVKEALGRGVKWEEEKKYDDTREKICHRARRWRKRRFRLFDCNEWSSLSVPRAFLFLRSSCIKVLQDRGLTRKRERKVPKISCTWRHSYWFWGWRGTDLFHCIASISHYSILLPRISVPLIIEKRENTVSTVIPLYTQHSYRKHTQRILIGYIESNDS